MGWSEMRCGGDCSRDLSRLIGECDARDKTSSRSRRTCARRRTNHTRITHAKAQTTPTESNGDIWKGGKNNKKSLRARRLIISFREDAPLQTAVVKYSTLVVVVVFQLPLVYVGDCLFAYQSPALVLFNGRRITSSVSPTCCCGR